MASLGQNPTPAELKDMINELDVDGSGKIEFQEFVQMMGVGDLDEELIDSFKVFDKNGDGFITEKELRDTLKTLH